MVADNAEGPAGGLRLSPDIYALQVAANEFKLQALEEEWLKLVAEPCRSAGVPAPKLIVVVSPFRRLHAPLIDCVTDLEKAHPTRAIAVVVPELVERRWCHWLLHSHTAAVIKGYLYLSGLQRVRW